jgi:hypothetical protein
VSDTLSIFNSPDVGRVESRPNGAKNPGVGACHNGVIGQRGLIRTISQIYTRADTPNRHKLRGIKEDHIGFDQTNNMLF